MSLRDRLPKHDTIEELEMASLGRLHDSLTLATRGRRHGALYLVGHCVEMSLKCALFRCLGYRTTEPIERRDLNAAAQLAREQFRISERLDQLHNPVFWARALIGLRDDLGPEMPPEVSMELALRAQRVAKNWAVALRYTREIAQLEEWNDVREDALWIRANYSALVVARGDITETEG